MSGTVGDFLVLLGQDEPGEVARRLADGASWAPWPGLSPHARHATPAPGVNVWYRGDVKLAAGSHAGGIGVAIEPSDEQRADRDVRDIALDTWLQERRWSARQLRGRFGYVFWDAAAQRLLACTDAFRSCPLYYAETSSGLAVATDLRLIVRAGLLALAVSRRAVYHYLNFSYVPAPFSAMEGVRKLPPGCRLESSAGRFDVSRYWDSRYPADLDGDDDARARGLHDKLVETVRRYGSPAADGWGTFLSGGTDSSSISGILSRDRSAPLSSFSIGFDECDYDELPYSRIASQAFGLKAHERRVDERSAVALIPQLARVYDEPFGNSSAIPTFYCAELAARHGVSVLVAGDGGDEIFGGNERYRKNQILEWYYRAPRLVRGLGSLVARALRHADFRFANRVKNFVRRGSLPNPDRFYTGDSFASDHYDELLSPEFRAELERDDSLEIQRAVFNEAEADSDLHRLMYLDLRMTIADNDVVKVVRASKLAGVQVVFPYLDRELVDYTGRLPANDKVRGLKKRFLFMRATERILPADIRNKRKQGFGLPVSVWMRRGGAFHDLVHDVVLSDTAIGRGYFRAEFVRRLIERHERGAWDYASEIYMLLMLELWHREYVDPPAA